MKSNDIPRVKGILLGDSGVGKTTLSDAWDQEKKPYPRWGGTIGVDFHSKIYEDVPVRLLLWDTAGQERFRSLSLAYYRGASLVFLVVDITNSVEAMLQQIEFWMADLVAHCVAPAAALRALYVVANKVDLLQSPQDADKVLELESAVKAKLCDEWLEGKVHCVAVSATEYIGVEELFHEVAHRRPTRFAEVAPRPGAVRLPELDVPPKRKVHEDVARCYC